MWLMLIYQKQYTSKAAKEAKDLSLFATWPAVGTPQSGLACRHHLSADALGLSVSDRHHGLAHPKGSGVTDIVYPGGRFLC